MPSERSVNKASSPPVKAPEKNTRGKEPGIDSYYASVSSKYRAAKYISVIAMIAFTVFSFVFLRRDITIENLRYLLKFISFTNTETSISADEIKYASGSPNRLELLIGDLCTLTPESYALYDSRGNQILSETVSYASPLLKVSSRFTLCCDLGGNSYSIFNTFTKLYSGTTDYPITDAAIADDGSFAIASSSREYRTAITMYDENFKARSRILKNDHLMGMEISPDGKELVVMTSGVRDGNFYTKIELVAHGSDTVSSVCELEGLGYSVFINSSGYTVITDERIYFLDSSLSQKRAELHTAQPIMSDASDKYLTLLYVDGVMGNSYTAKVFDNSGKKVFEGGFVGKLAGVDHDPSGDYIFILTGNTVYRINLVNKKLGTYTVKSDAVDVLVSDKDTVLAAYVTSAITYSLADITEHYYERTSEDTEAVSEQADTANAPETSPQAQPETPETGGEAS